VAYQSLYRRHRPATFADVVGQVPVVRTLTNAITEDRLHHAYLFTGPRGTGKTSIARILAKAVNCEQGPTPTPCGTCGSCTSIAAGTSLDVVELDMASHGGVDDARDLRERAQFAPSVGRRRVYILDEVHMASTAAFNALLKLLEEPPSHVLFAMATTDPQKVLPTIISRVQRLDLRRVAAEDVAAHVVRIVAAEGRDIDEAAVESVVRAGDGSVRDTLSILEQVLAFAEGTVTGPDVAQVLGTTPTATITATVDLLAAGDLAGLLRIVAGLVDAGQDLRRFTLDLVGHLRDLLVLQAAPEHPELVDATAERRAELVAQAGRVPRERVLAALEHLAATVAEQRQGSPRLPLELALATLTVPAGAAAPGGVAVAPAVVAAVAAPAVPVAPVAAPAPAAAPATAPAPAPAPAAATGPEVAAASDPAPAAPPAPGDALAAVVSGWRSVLEAIRGDSTPAMVVYEAATPTAVEARTLVLAYDRHHAFHADQAVKPDYVRLLGAAVRRGCAVAVDRVETHVTDGMNTADAPTAAPAPSPEPPVAAEPAAPADVERLLADRLDARPEA
jgi:DNA polymerase-3 subunit gamma/tau